MSIDISKLPERIKLEISKEDLVSFAEKLNSENKSKEKNKTTEKESELLSFKEMCEFLGIAKSTGYQRVSRGEIPHFKKGRRLYFRKKELIEWIESGRRKTKEDLDDLANRYLNNSKKFQK